MNFPQFFIDRPIFAAVLSIVIFIGGALSLRLLPISEYPEVVPPTVVVRATYPGANPQVVAETVATPLEQEINGVEGMLYMSSHRDRRRPDDADRHLRARHRPRHRAGAGAEPRAADSAEAAEEVRRLGVVTEKSSPDLTMVVHLFSPDQRYDKLYLRNYATLQRQRRAGAARRRRQRAACSAPATTRCASGSTPKKLAALNLTASDVVAGASASRTSRSRPARSARRRSPIARRSSSS